MTADISHDLFWHEASRHVEEEHDAEILTMASVEAAPIWGMVVAAESEVDFHNRLALMDDNIHAVARSVAAEGTPDYTLVVTALPAQWFGDWQSAHQARTAAAWNDGCEYVPFASVEPGDVLRFIHDGLPGPGEWTVAAWESNSNPDFYGDDQVLVVTNGGQTRRFIPARRDSVNRVKTSSKSSTRKVAITWEKSEFIPGRDRWTATDSGKGAVVQQLREGEGAIDSRTGEYRWWWHVGGNGTDVGGRSGQAVTKADAMAIAELQLGGSDFSMESARKVAWTPDESDVTPMARRIMDIRESLDENSGSRADDIASIKGQIMPFIDQISGPDVACLTDYNYHVAVEAIIALRPNMAAFGSRKMATQVTTIDLPGYGSTKVEGPWEIETHGQFTEGGDDDNGIPFTQVGIYGLVDGISVNVATAHGADEAEARANAAKWIAAHPMTNPDAGNQGQMFGARRTGSFYYFPRGNTVAIGPFDSHQEAEQYGGTGGAHDEDGGGQESDAIGDSPQGLPVQAPDKKGSLHTAAGACGIGGCDRPTTDINSDGPLCDRHRKMIEQGRTNGQKYWERQRKLGPVPGQTPNPMFGARKLAYGESCEFCGQEGCSPNCPGPSGTGTCPRCGSGTQTFPDGTERCNDPEGCGEGWPVGSTPSRATYSARTAAGESTAMACNECDRRFKKKIGPSTSEVKCPGCGGYDTEPTDYFGNQPRTSSVSDADKAKIMTPGSVEVPYETVKRELGSGSSNRRFYGLYQGQIVRIPSIEWFDRYGKADFYWAGDDTGIWDNITQASRHHAAQPVPLHCNACGYHGFAQVITPQTTSSQCPRCYSIDTEPIDPDYVPENPYYWKRDKDAAKHANGDLENEIDTEVRVGDPDKDEVMWPWIISPEKKASLHTAGTYAEYAASFIGDGMTPLSEADWQRLQDEDESRQPAYFGDTRIAQHTAADHTPVARWESTSGKYFVDLYKDQWGYEFSHPGGMGSAIAQTEAEAIAYVQNLVDMGGYFSPDSHKTPMKRVARRRMAAFPAKDNTFPPKQEVDKGAPGEQPPAAPGAPADPTDPKVDVATVAEGDTIMEGGEGQVHTYVVDAVEDPGDGTILLSVTKNKTEQMQLAIPVGEKVQVHSTDDAKPEAKEDDTDAAKPDATKPDAADPKAKGKKPQKGVNPFASKHAADQPVLSFGGMQWVTAGGAVMDDNPYSPANNPNVGGQGSEMAGGGMAGGGVAPATAEPDPGAAPGEPAEGGGEGSPSEQLKSMMG